MNITRRLRGFVGMATTWGVCFSALSTTLLLVGRFAGVLPPALLEPRILVAIALRGFVTGAVAGLLFALALAGAERRRTLSGLSTLRVALWGFLGTAAVPLAFGAASGMFSLVPAGVVVTATLLYGALGSAIATTIVGVARRAPAQALDAGDLAEPAHLGPGDSA